LSELGMWKMEEHVMYRKIMLYHNIMHSDDDRLIKKMVEEQERENESGTWYDDLCGYMEELEMDPVMVKEVTKSSLKKQTKERIKERMERAINESKGTKMRFIDDGPLEMKGYIAHGGGTIAIQTLKIRLNMLHWVYGNFKGDLELPRLCPHCHLADDTTEHLLHTLDKPL
jgi:hypothetical protein